MLLEERPVAGYAAAEPRRRGIVASVPLENEERVWPYLASPTGAERRHWTG